MGDDRPEEEEEEEEDADADAAPPAPPCPAVALRVVAAASWHVVSGRLFSEFPLVLAFLGSVAETAPELVPFRHLAKLRLGLQAQVVMNMLREDRPHGKIYDVIDAYFPEMEDPPLPSRVTAEDLEVVQTAEENFRILVLGLLNDCIQKKIYVQKHLETDYGEDFMQVVEDLFQDYLCQLENVLPEPQLQQLLEAASIRAPIRLPQPIPRVLTQYLTAVGSPLADSAEPSSPLPHLSNGTHESEEQEGPHSPPLTPPQPGRSQREDSPSGDSEGDSDLQSSISSETAEDLVPDSESEHSVSPLQARKKLRKRRLEEWAGLKAKRANGSGLIRGRAGLRGLQATIDFSTAGGMGPFLADLSSPNRVASSVPERSGVCGAGGLWGSCCSPSSFLADVS